MQGKSIASLPTAVVYLRTSTIWAFSVVSVGCLVFSSLTALGAGSLSAPVIDLTNASVTVTNGAASCCINTTADKVNLSVGGAVDYDTCGTAGNRINLAATRWSQLPAGPAFGTLETSTGATNKWLATSVGIATIYVHFNDLEDGADYNDDEAYSKSVAVRGFKVGCYLTTNTGGSYKKYHDGTTSGTTANCSGTLSAWETRATTGTSEDHKFATAKWHIIVVPYNTPIKGEVKINGGAAGTDGYAGVQTRDDDPSDGGSHSVTLGLDFVAVATYTYSTGADDNVAAASAAIAFQSDSAWLNTHKETVSDYSIYEDQATRHVTFSHAPDTAYFTGQHGDSKEANFQVCTQADVLLDENRVATGHGDAEVDWEFTIPANPEYVVP